jgi:hypothetical protein
MNTIKITPPPFELFTEELTLLKMKKIHIVCPALIKASNCLYYLADCLRMNINDVIKLTQKVEQAQEPGCLYPTYTFTIFPTHASGANLESCMEETMKAQEHYFKTDTMLFAFDAGAWPDMEEVKNVLQKKIDEWAHRGELNNLKKCHFD